MNQPTMNILPRTIGFDLGSKSSVYCVLDETGEISKEGSVAMSRSHIREFFEDEPQSRVILEASGSSRWTAQIAMELGHEVVVGNPRKISYITRSETKSDRNDAFKLSDLGQVRPRLLSPVRLRSDKSHEGRMHQRVRSQLVATRTSLINCVRGCARSSGHALPSSSTPAFVKCCERNLPAKLRTLLAPLLEQLGSLAEQIKQCNKKTEELGEKVFPEAAILRQVTGVGPVLSLAFVCAIDDPTCFKDSRGAGAYFGLAPKSRQSGGSAPQLRISKCGDSDVRRLLVSAATYILGPFGPDCDLRRYGKRLAKPGSQAAKAKARVAVARKLANLLLNLWITGEVYEPLRNHPEAAVASN